MSTKDDDILAGEYVLGTLNDRERAEARLRLSKDAAFAALVRDWEDRLAQLDNEVKPVAPPARLKAQIEASIMTAIDVRPNDRAPMPSELVDDDDGLGLAGNVIDLSRRLSRWRRIAALTTAMAAGLAGVIVYGQLKPQVPETGNHYVAVVNRDASLPALLVDVDLKSGSLTVRQVATEQQTDKSLELWVIPDGEKPRSLGVIDPSAQIVKIASGKIGKFAAKSTFAVTVEPVGGSPTDGPTGPVVYSGALIPAGD